MCTRCTLLFRCDCYNRAKVGLGPWRSLHYGAVPAYGSIMSPSFILNLINYYILKIFKNSSL